MTVIESKKVAINIFRIICPLMHGKIVRLSVTCKII